MTLQEVKESSIIYEQLKEMIEDEVIAVIDQHERQREYGKRKITYDTAYNIAHERVCRWVEEAPKEEFDPSNLKQLARWVYSCRRAKVWALIISRA